MDAAHGRMWGTNGRGGFARARKSLQHPRVDRANGLCSALQVAFELAEYRVDFTDRPGEILVRDVERRRDANDGAVRVLRQDAARKQPVDDRARARVTG